ncbi:MAG: DNA polymerase domain-containing protein, partial [Promethearchaeota archaeon]
FINGSYGVFGSKNFPLFCLPVAESTTGIGRYSIKSTIEKSKKMGIQVLYGDSDSVFLLNPSKQQLEEISKWSKEKLDLDLEEEKTYQFLALSERKKNYLGIYKNTKNVDIKGLIAKKKNTPNFIKKIFAQMLDLLKNVTNDEEFKKTREEIIRIVKENLRKIGKPNAFSLEDYVINISLQKDLNKYKKVIPQHVNAALELKKATGKELQKGEVVSFIKSKGHSGAKALELAKFQDIDVKKYQELLKSALEQVLDALGISFEEIRGIKKMDSYF